MSKLIYTLKRNKDGTVTFRSGRYIEHFDTRNRSLVDTYDNIRLAALSVGVSLQQGHVEELLREARGL